MDAIVRSENESTPEKLTPRWDVNAFQGLVRKSLLKEFFCWKTVLAKPETFCGNISLAEIWFYKIKSEWSSL